MMTERMTKTGGLHIVALRNINTFRNPESSRSLLLRSLVSWWKFQKEAQGQMVSHDRYYCKKLFNSDVA